MDRVDLLKAFVTVATEGSFTKAADKLDTSNQLVSKYVSQLESYLGARLFNRTTRRIHLTEAGEQCLQYAKHILEGISDMEGHVGQFQLEAKGLLRVSAPVSFSTLHLASLLRDFKQAHPGVSIDLQLSDRKVDVVEEGFDVALRIGNLSSSSLVAKKIAPIRLVMCASPAYLAEHGEPKHPSELKEGHYLRYSYMDYSQNDSPLINTLKQRSQKGDVSLVVNNGEILAEAAIGGQGYVLQPTFIVSRALQQGTLKIILNDYEPAPTALYALYPHRKLMSHKLRVFIDFLSNYFGQPPYWDSFE
ncbi:MULTISPECIES: LysR family transcriptional regulator [Pseudoalteromonas]|uniref:LysR family transcriptional regulator n=1 Tax=Pseudoalteromonas amylolytica TaxID=1859457 RepID=A0A1S1MPJ0_9GAMM|nr:MULTISPECIES: LysR family transcriptional regulator [Pseudoalteromonas]OHU84334.1 LysR family transcriptional regulator [Pseudoalteromonas sp. JW3]OHU87127.1 LysR family transcriptional regulator [Pseudoalteromonas amylolytica]